ncbi:MAG: TetR/AcrR family transcriptional regulator, partial [Chloroflexota bacterium]|nr:TetR/AcrR family transcriptional regulator [Chloroflexota bacterium]
SMTVIEPSRRGRPRNQRTHEAILEATRSLLLEKGYPALTIDAVAARAGTSKTTVYRRWTNKGALVLEATAENLAIGIVPDSGSTRTDLEMALRQLIRTFSDRLAAIVMLAVIANLDEDPSMALTFRDEIVYPWRTSAAAALERGVARGDLPPDADVPFLLDLIVGTVFQRAVINARSETGGLDEAILSLVLGR